MFDNKSIDHVSEIADQVAQSADHAIKTSQRVASDALDSVRNKAQHASDSTVRYIRNDPVKAMLIAAATGAALMALVNLVSHSRDRQ